VTYICVPILVEPPHDEFDAHQVAERALAQARAARAAGAKLVEWRVDLIADQRELIDTLIADAPVPCIVTCRLAAEGGEYDGAETDRVSLLEHIGLHARPRYIDVELAAFSASANLKQKIRLAVAHPDQLRELSTGLILSAHDFQGRPADLSKRLLAMAEDDSCEVVKVAWMARSLRDNLEAFDILSMRHKPTIALCMGPFGLMSRVLAPKFGGLVTFAALGSSADDAALGGVAPTAPGQPTIQDLRTLYRFDAINAQTRVFGVIGWPVEHSQSPHVHNAIFEATGFNGLYLPLPIPSEYEHFKATVGALLDHPRLDFAGCSVTLPHKANLIRFADERAAGGQRVEIDPLAREAGAGNTLARGADGVLRIANTDVPALVDSLLAALHLRQDDWEALSRLRIGLLGAGGAARAAVAGLSRLGCTVVIYNRSGEKAEKLAGEFSALPALTGRQRKVVAAPLERICKSCCQVFINATPVGMTGGPAPEGSPIPVDTPASAPDWGPSTLVFDMIYAPRETPLLRAAKSAGCATLNGLDMFIRQAALQSEMWTGVHPARALIASTLERA